MSPTAVTPAITSPLLNMFAQHGRAVIMTMPNGGVTRILSSNWPQVKGFPRYDKALNFLYPVFFDFTDWSNRYWVEVSAWEGQAEVGVFLKGTTTLHTKHATTKPNQLAKLVHKYLTGRD